MTETRDGFDASEYVECPSCRERQALLSQNTCVCLACKAIWRLEHGNAVEKLAGPARRTRTRLVTRIPRAY